MQLQSSRQLAAEMNLTPLIDILLVLLIIFMVVIPHTSLGERAEIPQPSRPDSSHEPETALVLQLISKGEGSRPAIKVNQEQVSWDNLRARLETIFSTRGDRTAFLKGDPDVDFEYVAEALDFSRRAGAERVGLISR
ncbi:MAG TPA: biopolymer transporter ExbD [Candidatus Limnocylindrales bacterium]|nr:biopolymer transporter ExbD [Candidatus Limnocylindrales bacterium]